MLCLSAHAQEKPDAPKPKHERKVFVTGVSLVAASKTADAITTRHLLDRGDWENNPAFGRHPSPTQQAGIHLGIFTAQSTVFYFTERSRHKWIRWAGRTFVGQAIIEHSRLDCTAQAWKCRGRPLSPGAGPYCRQTYIRLTSQAIDTPNRSRPYFPLFLNTESKKVYAR